VSTAALDLGGLAAAVDRWRREPSTFITEVLHDPETGQPYRLLPAERRFLAHAFKTNTSGRLLYPDQVYSAPKKSGKTAFAAMHALTMTLLFGGAYPEATCLANDLEQAQSRVFEAIRKIIECSPMLRAEARVFADRIEFPAIGATIGAISSDAAGAAGGQPSHLGVRRVVGLHDRTKPALVGRNDSAADPEDRVPADGDLCRLRGRKRVA
jgi:hypothetical protein